jgi:hypothetical protein
MGLASGLVRNGLRQQAKQLLADLEILAKLEDIRLGQSAVKDGKFDKAGADPAFAKAFHDYGIDVQVLGVQEAAAQIRQRVIAIHLAAALDDWAHARWAAEKTVGGTRWKRLLEVAREADPDPWRCAFREARATGRKEDLEKVLASAPIQTVPATTLALLGKVAQEGGNVAKLAVAVLREGQQLHPADFWSITNWPIVSIRLKNRWRRFSFLGRLWHFVLIVPAYT